MRRPDSWTLIEHPKDICKAIESIKGNHSVLIDSLGGLVEHHLIEDDDQWNNFQNKFLNIFTLGVKVRQLFCETTVWNDRNIFKQTSISAALNVFNSSVLVVCAVWARQ